MEEEGTFRDATRMLIRGLISIIEGWRAVVRTGLFFSEPDFWAKLASEDPHIIGLMFKALAVVSTAFQQVPKKITTPEEAKMAIKASERCLEALKKMLEEVS